MEHTMRKAASMLQGLIRLICRDAVRLSAARGKLWSTRPTTLGALNVGLLLATRLLHAPTTLLMLH